MVARDFQSYNFKQSVGFVNAVDVVDAAEEPRSRGGEQDAAKPGEKKEKKIHCPRRYLVEAAQDAAAAWEESGGARKSAAAEDLAMPLSGT